jgi:hypothetical protein
MRFWGGLEKKRQSAGGSHIVLSLLILTASGGSVNAQHSDVSNRAEQIAVSSCGPAESARLFREIDDPHSGARWFLVRDSVNPGGPGRMELAQPGRGSDDREKRVVGQPIGQDWAGPIIRTGDRLLVEGHSPTADVYLEGVALGPAESGAALGVRLRIGSKVVRAVAAGPGRAALAPTVEVRR